MPQLDYDIGREVLADMGRPCEQTNAVSGAGVELSGKPVEQRTDFALCGRAAFPPPEAQAGNHQDGKNELDASRHSEEQHTENAPGIHASKIMIDHAHAAVVADDEVFAGTDGHFRIIPSLALLDVRFD